MAHPGSELKRPQVPRNAASVSASGVTGPWELGVLGGWVLLCRGTPPGLTWGSRDRTPQVSRGLSFAEKDDQCLASFLNAV